MIFALAKFSGLVKQFNRRNLTEKDFFKICKLLKINVAFVAIPVLKGFQTSINGEITIFLDKNLKGIEFLFIAFHELAHAVLHESTELISVSFFNQFESKFEDEAETVALMSIFPTKSLSTIDDYYFYDDEFINFLVNKRKIIHQRLVL